MPDDIKELIEIGAYTEEEALIRCTENTSKDKRMVLIRPTIKMAGEEGSKTPVVDVIKQKYEDEDLILNFMLEEETEEEEDTNATNEDNDINATSDMEWLKDLE